MEKIYTYYKDSVTAYTRRAENLRKKIHLFGTFRLLLVGGLIAMIWFFKSDGWQTIVGLLFFFVLPFITLMVWHTKLYAKKCYAETLAQLCQNELNGLDYDFSAFDGAAEKSSAEHAFSLDLDLFGDRSLFQSINRTVTWVGREKLSCWFMNPLTDKVQILKRQEAVRELESFTQLRQHFYVTGVLQPGNKNDQQAFSLLNRSAIVLSHSQIWKWLLILFPLIWVLLFAGCLFHLLPWSASGLFFSISFLVAYFNTKEITAIHTSLDKMEQILSTYSTLIKCIEGQSFQSSELSDLQKQFQSDQETASKLIHKLSCHIGALNQRYSAIGLLLNVLTLRDTRMAMKLEQWRIKHGQEVERWFDALATFDAYCSLAGFAFNHPDYVYPEIADTYFQMQGKALGHPLLRRDLCVRNDIRIERSPWFLIITGANMAGKSTYLRTVGVNYLLGSIGLPVCAESLTFYPAQLVTSLRTSDSLASNESYFFAELKRLKMIIDRLQQGEQLFIILDEILKGTNSVDKQKGSLALMKQLIANQTCGIIATHDLVLGDLEQAFPAQVKNYRFEADIQDDTLTFSYQLREGIAQNMNACFLMKKMGITV